MWIKSDRWGTINWGNLSQATDNVALLPDLSGTIIESNAVLFDGGGMFVRPKGAKNANDMASDFRWDNVVTCLDGGGGMGADCNGYPQNGFRYDSPTWAGFSVSSGFYEDKVWDVALKYAADWGPNWKVSAAAGFDQTTDEGCVAPATCTGVTVAGAGGAPFQGFRKEVDTAQVGASIMHVPSGLWAYGLYQNEQNDGTKWQTFNPITGTTSNNSNANNTSVWFLKAGIKRTWTPLGATVIWGEGGQYDNMFAGMCSGFGTVTFGSNVSANPTCTLAMPSGQFANGTNIQNVTNVTGSTVNRWGVGIVQEIDAAAMHVFFRWQHLDVNLSQTCVAGFGPDGSCLTRSVNNFVPIGGQVKTNFDGLDIFQVGGVIFF
jgi:hypothetical protein